MNGVLVNGLQGFRRCNEYCIAASRAWGLQKGTSGVNYLAVYKVITLLILVLLKMKELDGTISVKKLEMVLRYTTLMKCSTYIANQILVYN